MFQLQNPKIIQEKFHFTNHILIRGIVEVETVRQHSHRDDARTYSSMDQSSVHPNIACIVPCTQEFKIELLVPCNMSPWRLRLLQTMHRLQESLNSLNEREAKWLAPLRLCRPQSTLSFVVWYKTNNTLSQDSSRSMLSLASLCALLEWHKNLGSLCAQFFPLIIFSANFLMASSVLSIFCFRKGFGVRSKSLSQ